MKVLQISDNAVISGSFNGYRLRPFLAEEGVDSVNVAWFPEAGHPHVVPFLANRWARRVGRLASLLEGRLGLQGLLHVQNLAFPLTRTFRGADLLHLHLVHNDFFSLLALPLYARLKPLVWTWHDPWALTGHCVHPMGCERWKTGCGACPDLEAPFAVPRDLTAWNWRIKRWAYQRARPEIIVASDWMRRLLHESPLARDLPVHKVPFGIDLDAFRPGDRAAARAALHIPPDHRVVLLRATPGPWKGLPQFLEAMRRVQPSHPVTFLVVAKTGYVTELQERFDVRELGWLTESSEMARLLHACDFVAMPSMAESFGLLAAEALACGRVVLGFGGTALEDTAGAPAHGWMVPYGDVEALADALKKWLDDPTLAHRRETGAREFATARYDCRNQAQALAAIYRAAIERRGPAA